MLLGHQSVAFSAWVKFAAWWPLCTDEWIFYFCFVVHVQVRFIFFFTLFDKSLKPLPLVKIYEIFTTFFLRLPYSKHIPDKLIKFNIILKWEISIRTTSELTCCWIWICTFTRFTEYANFVISGNGQIMGWPHAHFKMYPNFWLIELIQMHLLLPPPPQQ